MSETSNKICIFTSDTLSVELRKSGKPCDTLAVTFTFFGFENLDDPGVAEDLIHRTGHDQIIFKNSRPDWYQGVPERVLNKVGAVIAAGGYKRRVGYGISMGGYAALAFARHLSLTEVALIAPQVSLDPARAPGWRGEYEQNFWRHHVTRESMAGLGRIRCAYDPKDARETAQLDLLRATAGDDTSIETLFIPYSGHGTGWVMNDKRALKPFLLTALSGAPMPEYLCRAIPRTQKESLWAIGHALRQRRRFAGAANAYKRVIAAGGAGPVPWKLRIRMLIAAGRTEEARQATAEALDLFPDAPELATLKVKSRMPQPKQTDHCKRNGGRVTRWGADILTDEPAGSTTGRWQPDRLMN